jgi:hypothetical protein
VVVGQTKIRDLEGPSLAAVTGKPQDVRGLDVSVPTFSALVRCRGWARVVDQIQPLGDAQNLAGNPLGVVVTARLVVNVGEMLLPKVFQVPTIGPGENQVVLVIVLKRGQKLNETVPVFLPVKAFQVVDLAFYDRLFAALVDGLYGMVGLESGGFLWRYG